MFIFKPALQISHLAAKPHLTWMQGGRKKAFICFHPPCALCEKPILAMATTGNTAAGKNKWVFIILENIYSLALREMQ